MTGRFADPGATDTLNLPGGCLCPGTPHATDTWTYRLELGDGEEQRAGAYGWASTNGAYFDWEAARDKLIEIASVRWNLIDDEGPVPLRVDRIRLLNDATRNEMASAVDKAQTDYRAKLPNGSAASSVTTTRARATSTRKRKRAG